MEHQQMKEILEKQQAFFIKNGPPSYDLRIDRLNRMKTLIMENRYKIVDALNEDFGVRSKNQSMATDVYTCLLYTSPSPRDRSLSRMPSSA